MKRLQELLRPQDYSTIEETYKDYPLDWDKVFDFAYNLDVSRIQAKSSYRRGAIIKEIEKGTFVKNKKLVAKQKIINLTGLWEDLRLRNIRILGKSQYFINELEQYLIDNEVEPNELWELNHQIADYLKEGDDTEYFYEILKRSTLVKNNINLVEFETLAEQDYAEYDNMLKELNNVISTSEMFEEK